MPTIIPSRLTPPTCLPNSTKGYQEMIKQNKSQTRLPVPLDPLLLPVVVPLKIKKMKIKKGVIRVARSFMQPFVSMPPEVVAAVSLKNSQTKKGNKRVRLLRPKPTHVDGNEVKKLCA